MTNSEPEAGLLARAGIFLRSPFFPIFMIVFVDVLGLGITIPVLPLFAQGSFQASAFQIALMSSTYFVAQFIASPQLGRWSDTFGRRRVLLISQIGTFVALLISGGAPALAFLFIARAIDGFTGGNISVAQAYLSDITDEKNRAQGIGIVNAAFGSAFLFGPAFGALMMANFGPRVPYFIAAGVSVMTIIITYFLLPESLTPERRAAAKPAEGKKKTSVMSMLSLPGVALLLFIAFGNQLGFFAFQSIWVLWADTVVFAGIDPKVAQQAIGGLLALIGLVGVLSQVFLVKPIVKRFGERAMIAGGLFVRSIPFLIMALFPYIALVVAAGPLVSFGNGLVLPGIVALLTYLVPPDERGFAIGLSESVQGIGRIGGPLIAGLLFDNISYGSPMLFAAVMGFIAAALALLLWRIPIPVREPVVPTVMIEEELRS